MEQRLTVRGNGVLPAAAERHHAKAGFRVCVWSDAFIHVCECADMHSCSCVYLCAGTCVKQWTFLRPYVPTLCTEQVAISPVCLCACVHA